MLDLSYTFLILAMLGGFMLAIGVGLVGRGKGVKNTDIEEGRLVLAAPKARCFDVKASTRFIVGRGKRERFTRKWLERRLGRDIMTGLGQKCCCHIPDLIVANCGKSSI